MNFPKPKIPGREKSTSIFTTHGTKLSKFLSEEMYVALMLLHRWKMENSRPQQYHFLLYGCFMLITRPRKLYQPLTSVNIIFQSLPDIRNLTALPAADQSSKEIQLNKKCLHWISPDVSSKQGQFNLWTSPLRNDRIPTPESFQWEGWRRLKWRDIPSTAVQRTGSQIVLFSVTI